MRTGPLGWPWPPGRVLDAIVAEAKASRDKWGAYRSPHEAYGVLSEEMAELLEAMHQNDEARVRHEAMQVAAVAYRLAAEGWSRDG